MLRNEVLALMEALKLRGMQEVYDEVLSSGRKQRAIPEKVVLELLKAEAAERRLRSIRYRLGQARFPMLKDLDSFRFADSDIDEAQIRSLYEGGFLEAHSNLIFVGGTGTGKTHLAIAIAANLVRQGSRARFYNLVDLANDLEQENLAGRGGRLTTSLSGTDHFDKARNETGEG
jgi:DNA replication protein DnaC